MSSPTAVFQAIVDLLDSGALAGRVGLGEKPANAGWIEEHPTADSGFKGYVMVRPWSERYNGTLSSPDRIVTGTVQVSHVGSTLTQAMAVRDAAHAALRGQAFETSPGVYAQLTLLSSSGVARDDTVNPALFITHDHYQLTYDQGA